MHWRRADLALTDEIWQVTNNVGFYHPIDKIIDGDKEIRDFPVFLICKDPIVEIPWITLPVPIPASIGSLGVLNKEESS